jgi:XRE family transcriptional regulator, fatty acid utilization regulator
MIRIDRAGQSSKRYAGAIGSPLVDAGGRCPLWHLHNAFEAGGKIVKQLVELEDGTRWFTLARIVRPQYGDAEFAIGLGLEAALAAPLSLARGVDLKTGEAAKIGLGCAACTRPRCTQRSAPPAGRVLTFNESERGMSAFSFVGD